MQLRELKLPIAILHPEFLTSAMRWDEQFENVSAQNIESGYLLRARIFDGNGIEYAVDAVEVLKKNWWTSLISGGFRIDLRLRLVATHSVDQLKERFEGYLGENPSWWMNNDRVWTREDVRRTFGAGRNCAEVIGNLEWFSPEVY